MMSLKRVFVSFWIFGLVNNVLYVVILSAAVDLVGPTTPKAVVLLADVLPSFSLKIAAPFFIHLIPYNMRILILVGLSFFGMLFVSLSSHVAFILFGIVLASASSGLGETTFLQLTHYYSDTSLNAWSSGTGGAGLVGSFIFLVMTTWLSISPKVTLLLFSIVPFVFIFAYFKLLPVPDVLPGGTSPSRDLGAIDLGHQSSLLPPEDIEEQELMIETSTSQEATRAFKKSADSSGDEISFFSHIKTTLLHIKPHVVPYMLPLFTVYVAEYIINQGVSPTLLFDINDMPFENYRDAYVTYGTLYQLGLLGGAAYVNTFMSVTERTPLTEREFAMGCVGISDSAGIVLAASISMFLEPALCGYQVNNGRPWCRMH